MPRINELGRLAELRRDWYDNLRTIFQDCSSGSCGVYLSDGTPIAPHRAAGTVVGHGPHWAAGAWIENGSPGVTPYKGVFAWNGDFPGRALAGDGAGPDGSYAWGWHDSNGGAWGTDPDGAEWGITNGVPYNLQLLGSRRAIWTEDGWLQTTPGLLIERPGRQMWSARATWQTDRFVLLRQDRERGELVLDGRVILPGTNYFYPDVRWMGDHYLVAWSPNQADTESQTRTYTLAELATYPLIGEVPPDPPGPEQRPPEIVVASYDPLLKAGVPWAVEFTNAGDGTTFVVRKDARDRLWIEAENAAGDDATRAVRQLTVEGPATTPPEPPDPPDPDPPMLVTARFWCHPNIGSQDLLAIFDDPGRLAGIEMFGLYVQQILTDESTPQLGPNVYPALVAHDVFRKLVAAGVGLRIELGSVKPGDCYAQGAIDGMRRALQRVTDAGGVVSTITMDEPLTSNQNACHNDMAVCADAVADFIHAAHATDPAVAVGWIEAWPEVTASDHSAFLGMLAERNALPSYWHLDIDWNRAEHERRDPATFIRYAGSLCDQYGITLGVLVNSTVDPIATDADHHANLLALSPRLYDAIPHPAHLLVQSWATRTGGTQNIPDNLGPVGLLSTFAQVRNQFDPPKPQEPVVLSTYVDPVGGVIPVLQILPITGTQVVTLVLSNGQVFSCQPDGSAGSRPPGADGIYERCRVMGNIATFQPVTGKYFSWAFVMVGEL